MEYHLVHRLDDGRRAIATFETREKAEAHREVLIARDPRLAKALVILEEQGDEESGPTP